MGILSEGDSGASTTTTTTSAAADPAATTADGASGGAPTEQTATEVSFPENWKEGLPEDLRSDPSLQTINTIPDAIKSLIHSQKMVGANKVVVPGKHATEEDWNQFYEKVGVPKEVDKYEVNASEDSDKDFVDWFKAAAHEIKLLPSQAQKLYEKYSEKMSGFKQAQDHDAKQTQAEYEATLKKEFGAGFDYKASLAAKAVQKLAGDNLDGAKEVLDKYGLSSHPDIVRMFVRAGELLFKEDSVQGESRSSFALTPKEAESEIDKIMGDLKGPYYDAQHPNHKKAVQDVQKLMQMTSQ